MPLTFRETTYTELWGQGYPQESVGQQVTEATRVFLVPWEDRFQARLDFLGYSELVPLLTTNANNVSALCFSISRVTPDFHPGYLRPDLTPYLYADNVTFEPFGAPVDLDGTPLYGEGTTIDGDGEPVYGYAKMTVHYSARLFRIYEDWEMVSFDALKNGLIDESTLYRYVEIPYQVSAQYLGLPDGTFQWGIDGTGNSRNIDGTITGMAAGPVPGAPGRIDSQWDVTIVWRQVPRRMVAAAPVIQPYAAEYGLPFVLQSAFDIAVGRVNTTTFAGYPAGTLLCEPMELTQWVQADGEIVFDVTFHFKYYRRGWNYFLGKNKDNELAYSQISADGIYHNENLGVADGLLMYDNYPFQYLFLGYDFSYGYKP